MTSKFVSFLKVAGEVIANGVTSYFGLPPVFKLPAPSASATATATDVSSIVQAAIQVEAIGKTLGLTGPQKLQALIPQVFAILNSSLALGGKPIAQPALATSGATGISQGIVDFLNSLEPAAINTNGTTMATVAPTPVAPAA